MRARISSLAWKTRPYLDGGQVLFRKGLMFLHQLPYTSPGFDTGCKDRNPTQPALSAALNQRTARVEIDAPGFLSQLYHDFIIAAVILSC